MASFVKPTLFTPAVGARGMTTLHFAAYAGDLEAMEKALAAGLDPNARDDYRGYTALHWLADMSATGGPRLEMLDLLLAHGADLALVSATGETAVSLARAAASRGGDALAAALLARGAQPEPQNVLAGWHEIVRKRDPRGLDALLADDVVFHSPVVHTPQHGKAIALKYLQAAVQVFGNPSFRYVRELAGPRDAVLEFEVEIDGLQVNGVDMIRWNDAGQIVDFKVLVRPLKALLGIQQKMAALLASRS